MTRNSSTCADILSSVKADVAMIRKHKGRVLPHVFPSLFAVTCFRLSSGLRQCRLTAPARLVCSVAQTLTGAEIDPAAQIGPGLMIEHTHGVVIGPGVRAGSGLRLFGGALLGASFNSSNSKHPKHGFPTLGDDVHVLAKASILGPIEIGDGAVIGAHALVLDPVPAWCTARGVPARIF